MSIVKQRNAVARVPDVYAETAERQTRKHQPHVATEVVTTRRVGNIANRLVVQEAEHELGGEKHVHGNRSCGVIMRTYR